MHLRPLELSACLSVFLDFLLPTPNDSSFNEQLSRLFIHSNQETWPRNFPFWWQRAVPIRPENAYTCFANLGMARSLHWVRHVRAVLSQAHEDLFANPGRIRTVSDLRSIVEHNSCNRLAHLIAFLGDR
jgi:hypothetical protein